MAHVRKLRCKNEVHSYWHMSSTNCRQTHMQYDDSLFVDEDAVTLIVQE